MKRVACLFVMFTTLLWADDDLEPHQQQVVHHVETLERRVETISELSERTGTACYRAEIAIENAQIDLSNVSNSLQPVESQMAALQSSMDKVTNEAHNHYQWKLGYHKALQQLQEAKDRSKDLVEAGCHKGISDEITQLRSEMRSEVEGLKEIIREVDAL